MTDQQLALPPLRLLAGSGRSGTTWLQDVLCDANGLHPVFEPFHPEGWSQARPFSRRYASGQDQGDQHAIDASALERFWQALLTGDYPPTWIDYRVRPTKLRPPLRDWLSLSELKRCLGHWRKLQRHRVVFRRQPGAHILVKAIRSNLLLPRVAQRDNTPWALVLRHPAAVVESQLRLKGVWDARRIAQHYSNDLALEHRLGRSWASWTALARTDAELFTLIWCLENVLPLEDVANASDRVLFYESLANNAPDEWDRLLSSLELSHRPTPSALEKPSQQSSEVMGKVQSRKASALDRLTTADRNGIQRILDIFQVTFYHTDSLEPNPERLNVFRPWRQSA